MKHWLYIFLVLLVLIIGIFFLRQCNSSEPLAGIDANEDGVRDDVEKFIEQNYREPRVRIITRQLHKGIQSAIVNPEGTDPKEILFPQECLDDLYPDISTQAGNEIEAKTANTPERIRAYWKANVHQSGTILPNANSTEEACAFDKSLLKNR